MSSKSENLVALECSVREEGAQKFAVF